MRALCGELSARWGDLAAYQSAKVYPQQMEKQGPGTFAFEAPSSLTMTLRENAWMPATDPWAAVSAGDGQARRAVGSLVPPRLCYVATEEIKDLLGPQMARFCDVAMTIDFAKHVGTLCQVTPLILLSQLKSWAGMLGGFTTSVHQMEKVYRFLVNSHALKDFQKAVFTERLLWLPDVSPDSIEISQNAVRERQGQFFFGRAVRQQDPTGLVDRCACLPSHARIYTHIKTHRQNP